MGKYILLEYCPNLFYKLILFSFQNIIWLLSHLYSLWNNVCKKYVAIGLSTRKKSNQKFLEDVKTLRRSASTLPKTPKHIVIIFTNEGDISVDKVSDLVIWSVCTGTLYVTLYDKRGKLLNLQDLVKMQILKKLKALLGDEISKYSLVFKDSSSSYDNGYVHTTGICVQVISEEDSRKDIVDASQQIVEQIELECLESTDIDSCLVESKLKAIRGLPDPDFALQFGKVLFLDGCLPWQMRLTEIFSFESSRSMEAGDFLMSLMKFSRCEQRLGK